jgi:hypothetical protein
VCASLRAEHGGVADWPHWYERRRLRCAVCGHYLVTALVAALARVPLYEPNIQRKHVLRLQTRSALTQADKDTARRASHAWVQRNTRGGLLNSWCTTNMIVSVVATLVGQTIVDGDVDFAVFLLRTFPGCLGPTQVLVRRAAAPWPRTWQTPPPRALPPQPRSTLPPGDDPHVAAPLMEWLIANRRLATLRAAVAAAAKHGLLAHRLGDVGTQAWQLLARMKPRSARRFAPLIVRAWELAGMETLLNPASRSGDARNNWLCWFRSAIVPAMHDADVCWLVRLLDVHVVDTQSLLAAIQCGHAATAAELAPQAFDIGARTLCATYLSCAAGDARPRQLVAYFRAFGASRDAVRDLCCFNTAHRGQPPTVASVRAWGRLVMAAAAWVRRGALVALRARLREADDAWTAAASAVPRLAAAAGAARLRARGIALEP